MSVKQIGNGCPYKASITREPFLFYEMRTTAKLMTYGLSDDEIVQRIVAENLFQYPTERSVKRMAKLNIKKRQIRAVASQMPVAGCICHTEGALQTGAGVV